VKIHAKQTGTHGSNIVFIRNLAGHVKAQRRVGNTPRNNLFIDFTSPFAIEGPVVP
tara:strand:- start:214 stop:381 length:168 start_codon:yes stop_codon:yes gene_type:complete